MRLSSSIFHPCPSRTPLRLNANNPSLSRLSKVDNSGTGSTLVEDMQRHNTALRLFKKGKKKEAVRMLQEGREQNPENEFFCVSAGVMEAKMGHDDRARDLFKEALNIRPECVPSLHAWATMEMERGRLKEAEDLFRQSLDLQPDHVPSLQSYASLLVQQKNDTLARDLLQRALKINPEHLPVLHIMAEMEIRQDNYLEAIDILKKMLDADPGNVPAINSMGKLYWRKGDRKQARSVFASVEQKQMGATVAKVLCCWANLERHVGNVGLAREKLNQSLSHDSRHVSSLISLAVLEARAGNLDKAQQCYEKALKLDKDNPFLCNSVVHFLLQLGRREEAKKLLKNMLKRHPSMNISWHILGDLHVEEGSLQQARHCYETGMKINKAKGALLCIEGLADLELFLGNVDRSRELLIEGERRFLPTPRYYRMWANLEKKQGNNEAARKLFEKAHKRLPHDAKTLLQWGLHERRCGNDAKAEFCFLEGLKASFKNPFLWYSYGRMMVLKGCIEEARDIFEKALNNCPEYGPLIMEYGIMEWNQGNVEAARKLFKAGTEIKTGSVHLPLLEAWLKMETELENASVKETLEAKLQVLKTRTAASPRLPNFDERALGLVEKF